MDLYTENETGNYFIKISSMIHSKQIRSIRCKVYAQPNVFYIRKSTRSQNTHTQPQSNPDNRHKTPSLTLIPDAYVNWIY